MPGEFWREDVGLAPLTTLGVGGAARFFVALGDEAEAIEAFARAKSAGLASFVLGGGSNVLVGDGGFGGLVVQYEGDRVEIVGESGGEVLVEVGAGAVWDEVVAWAVGESLAGIACLSGIPGRVGAAPIQNIGAYGQEIAEVVEGVRAVERGTGEARWFGAAACGFGYRWSRFKGEWRDRFLITAVRLRLVRGGEALLKYEALRRRLGGHRSAPLAEAREAVLAIRRGKSMVYDTGDPNHRSAGSFFVNPVVEVGQAEGVFERAQALLGVGVAMPRYPAGVGRVKLSAAWLIERSGFSKGYVMGSVGLSSKHCLALINRGGARASEVVALAEAIQAGVMDTFGVALEPEPIFVGVGS